MRHLEDQVRDVLREMADEATPVHLLGRLDSTRHRRRPPLRRRTIAAVAATVLAALVTASLLLLRSDRPSIVEPVEHPPKVVRLSDASSTAPGRSVLAVRLNGGQLVPPAAYLLPVNRTAAVLLSLSRSVPFAWEDGFVASERLSADGTRLVRRSNKHNNHDDRLEVVNLVTGRSDFLGGFQGYCPELSPDNRTVAVYTSQGHDVSLVDVRTRSSTVLHRFDYAYADDVCGVGWSPDGTRLALRDATGTIVLDRTGHVVRRIPGVPTNGSMSWSPDGRSLLVYEPRAGRFVTVPLAGGPSTTLRTPADALKPLGWAGSRIVWLAGQPGDQSLVSSDQHGGDARTWTRLDVGDRGVEDVSWSKALGGGPG